MAYTREQRAANAAKEAHAAARSLPDPGAGQSVPADMGAESLPPPPPEGRQPIPRRNDPRNTAMDEIVAEHERRSKNEQPTEPPKEPVNEQPKPAAAPVAAPKPAAPPQPEAAQVEPGSSPGESAAEPVAVPQTVKQTVDGKEYDVPADEIEAAGSERAWRVNRAALNRLDEAKAVEASAKAERAQIATMAQQLMQHQQPRQPQPTQSEFIQSRIDQIRMGTPQEAATAMQEILTASVPNQQAMVQQAYTQAAMQVRMQSAVESFKSEFSDIAANPMLMRLAVALDNDRIRALQPGAYGPQFDFSEHYRKIGNEVRSLAPRQSQPQPTPSNTDGQQPQPSSVTSREARKASIVTLPTSSARATLPEEEKEPTREEIVNSLAKARGKAPIH